MRKALRRLTVGGAIAGLLIAAGAGAWYGIGRAGTSELEQWLGRQIVGILETHITPQVQFETVDYQAPKTVILTGLQITSEGQPLLIVRELLLELAEVPRKDQPIQIARVELHSPVVHFEANVSGEFAGWSNFVKAGAEPAPRGRLLSDVLVLRHVAIDNGEIVYADRPGSANTMRLAGVNLKLETEPRADEAGWYALAGSLERTPLLRVNVEARINLDTAELELHPLRMRASVGPEKYAALPPQVQRVLREHEIQGEATVTVEGRIALSDPRNAVGQLHAELKRARLSQSGLAIPLAELDLYAHFPQNHVELSIVKAAVEEGGRSIFALDALRLRLIGLPGLDPVSTIERLVIERPQVWLINDPAGGYVGWKRLLAATRKSAAADGGARVLPAEAVVLKELDLRDGVVVYDAGAGEEPVRVEAIHANLQMPAIPGRAGWHALAARVTQDPLVDCAIGGEISPSEGIVELEKFHLQAMLEEAQYDKLPSRLHQLLHARELHGRVDVDATGRLDLRQFDRSDVELQARLLNGGLTWNEHVWPIDQLNIAATLQDAHIDASFGGNMLGGAVKGDAQGGVLTPYPFELSWQADSVDIERTLRVMRDEQPKYAGQVNSDGDVSAQLADPSSTLHGAGRVRVEHGRLMNLPILRELILLVAKTPLPVHWPQNDTAAARFEIFPDRVQLSEADVMTALIAARGGGAIFYDGRLDLRVNAGVLERLQARMGRLGALLGSFSDRLMTYTVSGEISKPVIGVSPLGLGG